MKHLFIILSFIPFIALSACTPNEPAGEIADNKKYFFDDFNYNSIDDSIFSAFNWSIRTEAGSPGFDDSTFSKNRISFLDDESNSSNKLLTLTASTKGTSDSCDQAEILQQPIFKEGTYAARVRFYDNAVSGNDGDVIISTFFTINDTLSYTDTGYSECDFEYLPNGGWGTGSNPILFFTSWAKEITPGEENVAQNTVTKSYALWHTLILVVMNKTVKYYVDGELQASHGSEHYPQTAMCIDFNLWFSPGAGELNTTDSTERSYRQDVDWVFYCKDTSLSTAEVLTKINAWRTSSVRKLNDL